MKKRLTNLNPIRRARFRLPSITTITTTTIGAAGITTITIIIITDRRYSAVY
jgi:hypothetical protein